MADDAEMSFHELDTLEDDLGPLDPLPLPIDKEFHILICYYEIAPDREIAIEIDRLLESEGYKCCLHERDSLSGDFIISNIETNIKRSIKVVYLLSENSKACEWCQFELALTETIHIENKGYKPIILKLDDCSIPDTLNRYTCLKASSVPKKWMNELKKAINDTTDHLITSRKSIKFVPVPCIDYNRDKDHLLSKCRYPHVCAKYIISDESCDGSCGKNHNLVTEQSRDILVDVGFITDGHDDSLRKTYVEKCREKLAIMPNTIVTGPCCYYNYKGCLLGDFHCPFTHICKKWFLGNCTDENCEFSHDILNYHTKRLMEIFEINTNQPVDIILDQYREKYPHKLFLTLQTKSEPFDRKQILLMFVSGVTIALIAAIVVLKIHTKSLKT